MNLILTEYIFPIEKKICISRKFKIYLDNPRSRKEIESIMEYIIDSNENTDKLGWAPYNKNLNSDQFITIENTIETFKNNFSNDKIVQSFFEKDENADIYEQLAKMWVIARYDDEDELDSLRELDRSIKKEEAKTLIILDNDNPLIRHTRKMKDYCYLLSLLINTDKECYNGESFIMETYDFSSFPISKDLFNRTFIRFMTLAYTEPEDKRDETSSWRYYPNAINLIVQKVSKLDLFFDGHNEEKLLYIANMLKVAGKGTSDYKLKIITLVSILEMLLTHNPNFNRFNVEDSINKQFQLKAGLVIYLSDNTENILLIKKKLKVFYSLRSCIAHGNFKSIDKIMRKIYAIYKDRIDKINSKGDMDVYYSIIISELYSMIRNVIDAYLEDKDFIEFLKDG